jgi:hypothetical protein
MVALTVFKFTAGKKIFLENKENLWVFCVIENKILCSIVLMKTIFTFLITVNQFSNYYTHVM